MPKQLKRVPQPDPAIAHNQAILEERERRETAKNIVGQTAADLGLGLSHKPPKNATEFLRDEFDKKNFGGEIPTYTRILYGPDPLLNSSPWLKEQIEQHGLEEMAEIFKETIMEREERAVDDQLLRTGLKKAIYEFGKEEVAAAFAKRILKIPQRTVQIEAEREDEVFGRPLEDAVRRYGSPGMAPKFLSERCLAILGMRGYRIVKDEHGDPVKVGTLIMGEIPIREAERRRALAVKEGEDSVREQEEAYLDSQARIIKAAEKLGAGLSALQPHDSISGSASSSRSLVGEELPIGFQVEREAA